MPTQEDSQLGRKLVEHKLASANEVALCVERKKELEEQGIIVQSHGRRTVLEEIPEAYKDVKNVVDVVHNAGISKKVARHRPLGVIKGWEFFISAFYLRRPQTQEPVLSFLGSLILFYEYPAIWIPEFLIILSIKKDTDILNLSLAYNLHFSVSKGKWIAACSGEHNIWLDYLLEKGLLY